MFFITVFYATFAFLFGITIGSFLNVCVYRMPLGISVAVGRSFCPSCGKQLLSRDMIPIFSFLLLKGRCRFCKAPISPRYPLVELTTGLLFVLAFFLYGWQLQAAAVSLFFATLLVVALIDQSTGVIPDRLILAVLFIAVFYMLCPPSPPLSAHLAGALVFSVPMFLLAFFFNGFGGGDIKLSAAAGLLLGWRLTLLAAFVSIVSCGLYSAFLLLRKKASAKTELPFGPFLSAGMILSLAFGNSFLAWYAALFTGR